MSQENKLPKDFKRKWLKALRSGQYNHVAGKGLKSKKGYCCLGVAAEISGCTNLESSEFIDKEVKGWRNVPKILRGTNPMTAYLAGRNDSSTDFDSVISYIKTEL